ncbi:Hypothetical protein CAP_4416 [Chondromyces apiculatus DSM 436]|uniref:Uncharacterized protein n=2 Tax=Chondromyces apiculatus TaxID=51 RepID=A0A017T5A2_9BACT|nr:Hypothetical protein CAP_4416 [Chondromyces apiculatus DSM 436]
MHIDARGVLLKYVDGADLSKVLKLRNHHDRAMNNIMVLTEAQIELAGLNEGDVERLRARITEYRTVLMFLAAAQQMTDNLQQTVYVLGHDIAAAIGEITAQARRRAKVSPDRGEILNALNQVIDYQLAPAKKGKLTRKAKKEAAEGSGKPETPAPSGDEPGKSGAAAPKQAGVRKAAAHWEDEGPVSVAG